MNLREILQAANPKLFVSLLLVATSIGATAQEVDVTGAWVLNVVTDAGDGTPTVTFMQEGAQLTGHYSSGNLGEAGLTGTVDGREITFVFTSTTQGLELAVVYTGMIEGSDAMAGMVDFGGLASGTFTGERQ